MKTLNLISLSVFLLAGLFYTNINAQNDNSKISFLEDGKQNVNHNSTDLTKNLNNKMNIFTSVVKEVSCFGKKDAVVYVDVKGGQPPYQFSLNGSSVVTENSFNNLSAGDYFLLVTDNSGNKEVKKFTIEQPEKISFRDLKVTESDSYFGQYSISVCAHGGHGAISYSINDSEPQLSGVFNDLKPSVNKIVAIDFEGCTENIILNLIDSEFHGEVIGFAEKKY